MQQIQTDPEHNVPLPWQGVLKCHVHVQPQGKVEKEKREKHQKNQSPISSRQINTEKLQVVKMVIY